jgi:phosphatidylserine decarboxylase
MRLTRYGSFEWITAGVACAAVALLAAYLGWWWLVVLSVVAWVAIACFFRDPPGRSPASDDEADLVSPADGRISAIVRVEHHEATDGPAVIVRIFLSVLNVHLNRSPCTATVRDLRYRPGRYLDARTEESARVNESNLILLQRPDGTNLGVRQVSGAVARRIVCPLRQGDALQRAAKFGMIKFGSTTELIVPDSDSEDLTPIIHVKIGESVRAGVTILATLRSPARDQS